ncbi:GntR family transcriptional regulator [Rhodanobacter sp. 115]|uniref:GntR family transcriptional regulator n=1 Tax=Rhodanobacter sp. FW021-MT20 TaxID=1162282 RepID=UPI0034E404C1
MFEPLARRTPSEQMVDDRGRLIVVGRVMPREVLPREAGLAEDLRVSRGVLREATRGRRPGK